jgi:phospholipid/cholesterol/gamma-HCH transport system ATP-binding protein
LENICLTLGGSQVLKDVSFHLMPGETGVILGASGSGKTTILRLILGLFKPDSGRIFVDGKDITDFSEEEMMSVRAKMGMVFQAGALFDSMTVGENVAYRLTEKGGHSPEEIEEKVRASLRFVGLEDSIDQMPAELSGGMKKRVSIARGIITQPKIMLYDEPSAGLDPLNSYNITNLIKRLQSELGVTSVVVTHDIPLAFEVANNIAFLHEGAVCYSGNTDGLIKTDEQCVRAFINHSGCVDISSGQRRSFTKALPVQSDSEDRTGGA